ncbi:hypothetical protein TREMEDRAFT_42213 [Tremella mesenterica DSM 1558]|nr:uncharacterized protein TREMEDRAFT_42213 [Tremella mesenterica DSM 1558]EIW73157.1 hypothetical protein TREMEDRAFT_42213 [Tremella mesenterica DSM 1558]
MLDDEEEEIVFDDDQEMEDEEVDVGEPLVSRGRGRKRRRRRWEGEDKSEKGLFELIPPLMLAHPLALFPLLAILPYNFLPAGVVFFIPILCVLVVLSCCAHIVIVYLSWYLKVHTFEDVFAVTAGKYSLYGLWAGRVSVIIGVIGMLVGWLGTLHPLLLPVVETYIGQNAFLSSRALWTVLPALALLPSLLPSRMMRSLRRAPVILALLLPVVAFLIIGRTVEITKIPFDQPPTDGSDAVERMTQSVGLVARTFGLRGGSSAGAGITTLTVFLSPHINTLPIHSTLTKSKRSSFPLPCLISSSLLLLLALPLALVPYYLLPDLPSLPTATPTSASGVFARLPSDDAWLNLARILMATLTLGSSNMWILRGRDTILRSLGVERGERLRAGKWVGVTLWFLTVLITSIGGWLAAKVELLGVGMILSVCWLLPSVFFIVTFHVRSPLAIVFPSTQQVGQPTNAGVNGNGVENGNDGQRSHSRTDSLQDPSVDALLARKERQLQKRRLGRRLWQDLIVYVGILPVGCVTLGWTLGSLLGIW